MTNQLLQPGDRVRTLANSRSVIKIASQSLLRLREFSEFLVPPRETSGRRSVLQLLRGFFHVFGRDPASEHELRGRFGTAATRGTEFHVAVTQDGRMEVAVLEGEVLLRSLRGEAWLAAHQQGVIAQDHPPQRTAELAGMGVIQWCLYYPAVLDLADLSFSAGERAALAESLAAYETGDLPGALRRYPANRVPASDAERLYRAALALAVGEVDTTEGLLGQLPAPMPSAEALRKLVAAVQFQPHTSRAEPASASEWLAESYYRQSRSGADPKALEGALAAAQQATVRSPHFGYAWARWAELEFSFGRAGKAAWLASKALDLAPRNAQAVALSGFLLSARSRLPEAIARFDQAIALDSGLANAWLGRGLCRIRRGDLTGGRADLLTAAALEPQRAVLRSYLGKAWSITPDDALARKEFHRARELDANDPTSWLYSALHDQEYNRVNRALHDLEQSAALNENRRLYRSEFLPLASHRRQKAGVILRFPEGF